MLCCSMGYCQQAVQPSAYLLESVFVVQAGGEEDVAHDVQQLRGFLGHGLAAHHEVRHRLCAAPPAGQEGVEGEASCLPSYSICEVNEALCRCAHLCQRPVHRGKGQQGFPKRQMTCQGAEKLQSVHSNAAIAVRTRSISTGNMEA